MRSLTSLTLQHSLLALVYSFVALSSAAAAEKETTQVYLSNGQLDYVGLLDEAANQRLYALYDSLPIKPTVLSIRSPGGEVSTGMSLGSWVREHKLDVQVLEFCASSCANYVFPAGIHKIVSNFAVIGYHGGPGDPRHLAFDGNTQKIYDALSPAEQRAFMDDINKMSMASAHRETDYLQHLGVRADITSMGQHEQYASLLKQSPDTAGWTYTLEDFALLGVRDITVINPPWKPGSALQHMVFVTIPVDKQANSQR